MRGENSDIKMPWDQIEKRISKGKFFKNVAAKWKSTMMTLRRASSWWSRNVSEIKLERHS